MLKVNPTHVLLYVRLRGKVRVQVRACVRVWVKVRVVCAEGQPDPQDAHVPLYVN